MLIRRQGSPITYILIAKTLLVGISRNSDEFHQRRGSRHELVVSAALVKASRGIGLEYNIAPTMN